MIASTRLEALRASTGILLLALFAGELPAKVLRDKKTGLTVKAPQGIRLKAGNGLYSVTDGNAFVKFLRVNTPLTTRATARDFVKQAKVRRAKFSKKGRRMRAEGKLKGKPVEIEFRPKGAFLDILTSGTRRKRARVAARSAEGAARRAFTVDDILNQLERVARSRRGGRILPLPFTIPVRNLNEGGATAVVPNLPGWTAQGSGGAISGGNMTEGAFGLGLFWPLGGPVLTPDQAVVQAWPAVAPGLTVTGLAKVPGTDGWLGSGYLSAMYTVTFTLGGRNWQGLIVSGSTDFGTGFAWYQSYIAVPVNGPSGIAPALVNTWSSWDPSVSGQARLNQALAAVRSTPIPGSPIDPEAFDRTSKLWVDYIRF